MQRITVRGKRCELGLGSPPTVSLAKAREMALANRSKAVLGGDPLREKLEARKVLTFEEAARRAHIELSPTWKNPKDVEMRGRTATSAGPTGPGMRHLFLPTGTRRTDREHSTLHPVASTALTPQQQRLLTLRQKFHDNGARGP